MTCKPRPAWLFVSSFDGALYDCRVPSWNKKPPLRPVFRRSHPCIETTHDLKAALRAGPYAWPGGYQMYFLCDDGAALCFDCVWRELRNILPAVAAHDRSGWNVVALDVNHDSPALFCDHCNNQIKPNYYGEDD